MFNRRISIAAAIGALLGAMPGLISAAPHAYPMPATGFRSKRRPNTSPKQGTGNPHRDRRLAAKRARKRARRARVLNAQILRGVR